MNGMEKQKLERNGMEWNEKDEKDTRSVNEKKWIVEMRKTSRISER